MSKNKLIDLAAAKGYTLKKDPAGIYTVFDGTKGIKRCGKIELLKWLQEGEPMVIPAGTQMDLRSMSTQERDRIIAQMSLG